MNEKFKLLALEAKMGTADFDAGSYYVATSAMMQQFCELIVLKCCEIADEAEQAEQADVEVFASKFIRAHFEVE